MFTALGRLRFCSLGFVCLLSWTLMFGPGNRSVHAGEPPAISPFGPVRHEREDAIPGYLELSDGKVYPGAVYMTRDKRLKLYDAKLERQREVPLRVVKQIECKVLKEWMEKEWRFKELARSEKYYTGRQYPSREYAYTITLQDDRTITGPLAEIIYVKPYGDPKAPPSGQDAAQLKAERFLLHKRDKGEVDRDLKSLVYVRLVKLGEEALEEGRQKATRQTSEGKASERSTGGAKSGAP